MRNGKKHSSSRPYYRVHGWEKYSRGPYTHVFVKTDYTFLMMLEGKRFRKEGNWLSYFGEMWSMLSSLSSWWSNFSLEGGPKRSPSNTYFSHQKYINNVIKILDHLLIFLAKSIIVSTSNQRPSSRFNLNQTCLQNLNANLSISAELSSYHKLSKVEQWQH